MPPNTVPYLQSYLVWRDIKLHAKSHTRRIARLWLAVFR